MVNTLDPGQACPGIPTTWKRREEGEVQPLSYQVTDLRE